MSKCDEHEAHCACDACKAMDTQLRKEAVAFGLALFLGGLLLVMLGAWAYWGWPAGVLVCGVSAVVVGSLFMLHGARE